MDYYILLNVLHKLFAPGTYLEIGVRQGASLALALPETRSYGIDPNPNIAVTFNNDCKIYACTSDEFFERFDALSEVAMPLDMAFIDGMHLFEYALRDFIHIEALSHGKSIIVLHDTYPRNAAMADRTRTVDTWCGDIYKLLLILKKYRPELEILHFDAPPAGLAIVKGINPKSAVLSEQYEHIVKEFFHFKYEPVQCIFEQLVDVQKVNVRMLGKFLGPLLLQRTANAATPERDNTAVAANFLFSKKKHAGLKMLGILLCYNDADILGENIEYLLSQNHDLVVWDHGSTDHTASVLDHYKDCFIERRFIPREFDFYGLYEAMSQNVLDNYVRHYDVISWPDQDEFLEGPFRDRPYHAYLEQFFDSPYSWIRFNNMNFWFSHHDDMSLPPTQRIKHYGHMTICSPRIRAWKAKVTNIRHFNHNPLASGVECPVLFNLRHYPCRSHEQMMKRIYADRANLERKGANVHYNAMHSNIEFIERFEASEHLIVDDGKELSRTPFMVWKNIYERGADAGTPPRNSPLP